MREEGELVGGVRGEVDGGDGDVVCFGVVVRFLDGATMCEGGGVLRLGVGGAERLECRERRERAVEFWPIVVIKYEPGFSKAK